MHTIHSFCISLFVQGNRSFRIRFFARTYFVFFLLAILFLFCKWRIHFFRIFLLCLVKHNAVMIKKNIYFFCSYYFYYLLLVATVWGDGGFDLGAWGLFTACEFISALLTFMMCQYNYLSSLSFSSTSVSLNDSPMFCILFSALSQVTSAGNSRILNARVHGKFSFS